MSGKSKINIFKNMDEVELYIAIKEYSGIIDIIND